MSHTLANPDGLHDPTPFGYSHTATVPGGAELVFVSGQWGSDPEGSTVSSDFAAQVSRAFDNLGTALAAHGLDLSSVVQLRSYVIDHDFAKLGVLGTTLQEHWGGTPPTHTVIGVASLATPDISFEVEAIAARQP